MLLSEFIAYLNIAGILAGIVVWILILNDLSKKWKDTCLLIIAALGIIIIISHVDDGKTKTIDSMKAVEKRLMASQDSIKKLLEMEIEKLKSDQK